MCAPRFTLIFAALLAASWSAAAQDATPVPRSNGETVQVVPGDNTSQRIERIQIEDPGAKIDELRVGGQTQSITVQPSGGLPQYNVQPAASGNDLQRSDRTPGSSGPRTWKILGF